MAYAIFEGGRKIRKITGNPRSKTNQKGVVVWASKKEDVKKWVVKWGTKTQKKKYL